MSRVVANLDAAIEAHRAQQPDEDRRMLLYGRQWKLEPELTTVTLNPILQLQAEAEEAKSEQQQMRVGMRALVALQETILGTVIEEERADLRKMLAEVGYPLPALETIIETIMGVYTAAPLPHTAAEESETQIPELPRESITDSTNSSTPDGQTSNPAFTPPPPTRPMSAAPAPPNGFSHRPAGQELPETTDPRWTESTPQEVQEVVH